MGQCLGCHGNLPQQNLSLLLLLNVKLDHCIVIPGGLKKVLEFLLSQHKAIRFLRLDEKKKI